MEKLYYFIIFTTGITILMKMAGIPYAGENEIINWLGLNIDNFAPKTSLFYLALTAPIIGLFAIAAVIGLVASNKEASLRAGLASGILGVGVGSFIGILSYIKDIATDSQIWIFYVTFLIFAVYIVGYVLATIEWWSNG
jgi:hypothetical protein